jgi:hypothetical protein
MSARVIPRVSAKRDPGRVHVGGYVPVEQQRRLIARAREEDRSVSAILRRAIDGYLASPPAPGSGVTLDDVRAEAALLQPCRKKRRRDP